MGTSKQNKKHFGIGETQEVSATWRTPISLSEFEAEDPLENFYMGREVGGDKSGEFDETDDKRVIKEKPTFQQPLASKIVEGKRGKIIETKPKSEKSKSKIREIVNVNNSKTETTKNSTTVEILTETDLKKVLKIKSEFFRFTDIREILRGKSFDIYSYLVLLAGEEGICKIKHLDLMDKLEISRPTLFKQEEWLVKLRLIEKRNVPGDHLGTSYTVNRLEDVLPVPTTLVKQLNANVENLHSLKF